MHSLSRVLLAGLAAACGSGAPPDGDGETAAISADAERQVVLVLGTSLSAGLGVAPDEAYPALLQARIDSVGLPFRVVNAGENGSTSAGGLRRLDWLLRQRVDVVMLELGANDGLRGQDVDSLRANLLAIVRRTRAAYAGVDVVLAGMEAPPNMGARFTSRFREVFPDVARSSGAALIPFLLDGVGGVPGLNQVDGIHPNAAGHAILADNVWRVVEPILRRRVEMAAARAAP